MLGQILSATLGGVFGEHLNWRGIFLVFGVAALVVGALLARESNRFPGAATRPALLAGRDGRPVGACPRADRPDHASSSKGASSSAGWRFSAASMLDRFSFLGPSQVGLMLAGYGVGGLFYSITVKRLVPQIGERGILLLGGCLLFAAYLAHRLAAALVALHSRHGALRHGLLHDARHAADARHRAQSEGPLDRRVALRLHLLPRPGHRPDRHGAGHPHRRLRAELRCWPAPACCCSRSGRTTDSRRLAEAPHARREQRHARRPDYTRARGSQMRLMPAQSLMRCHCLLCVAVSWPRHPARTRRRRRRNWAQWRGPHATGVSTTANPPLEWSETKNIKWKVEIPGRGHASPVVWGDRVFVLTAVPVGVAGRRAARAARRAARRAASTGSSSWRSTGATGRTLWERVATEQEPHEAGHTDNSTLGVELADHRRRDASSPTSSRSASTPTT